MAILSTNQRLINVGDSYSAGSGIDITDHIISVTGEFGQTYSAGDNIGIYEQDNQLYISGKDWTNDIEQASANAYEQAIAQIPEPQDLSYLSGRIDTNTSGIDYISSVCLTAHQDWTDTIKGASSYSYEQSTSYFDNWVSGQYTGDITNITNKITALSGDLGDYYKKTETSSKDEINDALQYVSANAGKVYEGVSPIVVNNVEDKISADTWTFSAGSNVSFVDDNVNKITRIDVELPQPQDLSYISAQVDSANAGVDYLSGVVITALPSDMATTGDIADLAQSVSETYQTKGDYLTTADSANFYPNTNPSSFVNENWVTAQGYITGVDLSEYAKRTDVLSSIESATSGKLDVSSFASVSSDFLTNEDLNGYATESFVENVSGDIVNLIPDTSNFITNSSAEATYQPIGNYLSSNALEGYATNESLGTASSFLSGAIDYVSANVTGGGVTGDYVSGSNTASTDMHGYTYGYSATISGDVSVDVEQKYGDTTCDTWHYSLFNVGSALDNKLNVEYISGSNTIKKLNDNDNHYEVVGKSYREVNIKNISASEIDLFEGGARIGLNGEQGYYLKSAIITIESNTIGSFSPDWTLQSSAGGSAVLTKSYTDRTNNDSTYLWGDWNITNIDASATVFSGYELAELAFKDEIPSGGVTGDFVPLSSFNELKQSYDALSSLFATYSGQWLLPNEGEK